MFACYGCGRDSRELLAAPHSNPADPAANDLLTTAYHTIISSTLLTWSPPVSLSAETIVAFVQSVLGSLPSPSSAKSSNAVAFGELLVDLIWSIDVDVDELYQDAKLVVINTEQGKAPAVADGEDSAAAVARATKVKQDAERDKETLAGLVKQLVVSAEIGLRAAPFPIITRVGCRHPRCRCVQGAARAASPLPRWPHPGRHCILQEGNSC